ncbi:MAG: ASCH domain-containing protein [Desulfobulbus sp.]
MIALSIRQPWVHHIFHNGKDIENRTWSTRIRGRVLIHAAMGLTREQYENGQYPIQKTGCQWIELPPFSLLDRGGIFGSVEIVDCVNNSASPWFFGPFGFVLRNPEPLPFLPWKGQLGFFRVPDSLLNVNDHNLVEHQTEAMKTKSPHYLSGEGRR